jgi:hypothetical protein
MGFRRLRREGGDSDTPEQSRLKIETAADERPLSSGRFFRDASSLTSPRPWCRRRRGRRGR